MAEKEEKKKTKEELAKEAFDKHKEDLMGTKLNQGD